MRTTLDLDERLLAAARARARRDRMSLGTAVSQLALAGLEAEAAAGLSSDHGLVLLPATSGLTITDDMVADALADD